MPRWTRWCIAIGTLLMLLSVGACATQQFLVYRYEKNLQRADLLGDQRGSHSGDKHIAGPLTFLVLGLDKRAPEDFDPNDPSSNTWTTPDDGRADTIMVIHISEDLSKPTVLSIPRDSYVDIPAKGSYRGGKDKINAAYFYGGAPLMVATVNKLLGIRVDYPIIVNFTAVREITDAVGGVDVTIDTETYDPRTKRTWKPGRQHLDGRAAEAYVRQRYGLEGSDYDRQHRQQQFLGALGARIEARGIASNPTKLDRFLRVLTSNLTVDHRMPVKELVFALKSLRPANTTYLKLPMAGSLLEDGVWYEQVDLAQTRQLGSALRQGSLRQFVARHPTLRNDVTHGR